MSVDELGPYRMPQPEQWLSEHEPWATVAIVASAIVLAVVAGWLT